VYEETFTSISGCDSVVTLTLVINQCSNVPTNKIILNQTESNGSVNCYNALNEITLAGNGGSVVFQSGSSVTLIAGQSIRFLPGFHAQAGSYVEAYITTTNSFCDELPQAIVSVPQSAEKSIIVAEDEIDLKRLAVPALKAYPNPNKGSFNVKLTNVDTSVQLLVFNSIGEIIYSNNNFENETTVNIENAKKGIYFVRAIFGNETLTQKVIVE